MVQKNSGNGIAAATQTDVLPASGVILLGTFNKAGVARALIRNSQRRVEEVSVGDMIGRQYVAAIDSGTLVLMKNGEIQRLTIPGK